MMKRQYLECALLHTILSILQRVLIDQKETELLMTSWEKRMKSVSREAMVVKQRFISLDNESELIYKS